MNPTTHPRREHRSAAGSSTAEGIPLTIAVFLILTCAACVDGDPCAREQLVECDIRDDACQRYVFEAAQCVRQTFDVEMPPTRVMSREELAAEIAGRGGMPMMMERASGPLDLDDPIVREGLEIMAIVAEERSAVDSAWLDRIGGVFFPDTREVIIVDSAPGQVSVLAHEYIHSMQPVIGPEAQDDVYESTDQVFRLLAGVEGEARFFEVDVLFWLQGGRLSDHLPPMTGGVDLDALYDANDDVLRASSASIGSSYEATRPLRYELGLRFATARYLDGGVEALREWPSALPAASADLFAYSDARIADLPTIVPPTRAEATCRVQAPMGLALAAEDSLGGAHLYTFLYTRGLLEPSAERFARALDADRIAIYAGDSGTIAVTWRLQLADGVGLDSLRDQMTRESPPFEAEALDGALILRASNDPALLSTWPLACR